MGLLAEIAGVHQKQDAPRAAELEQAINRRDRGEGLARAGRHLHQRPRLVQRQRSFQPADRVDLALAQIAAVQVGHPFGQPPPQRGRLRQPAGQRFGPEEVEDFPRARSRIATVGEADHLSGALEQER